MNEGASVREHVINMMVHFNVAEMNEVVIDEASQVIFILESIPESFLQFRSNVVTLTILLNELQTFESLMKIKGQKREANVATSTRKFHRGSTSGTKYVPSSSGNKKWKKKNGGQGNKANPAATNMSKKAKAAKGICFHCNQEGHCLDNRFKCHYSCLIFISGNWFLAAAGDWRDDDASWNWARRLSDCSGRALTLFTDTFSFIRKLQTAVYILNCVPSKSVSETPFKLWNGRKGYPKGTRCGYFYDSKDNKVFVSKNATFLEEDHIRKHKRVDLLTFKKAMEDVDKDKWINAMNLELEFIYFNLVWDLVDQLDGVKPIGWKWIYKRKRGADGKVQAFKARLVAKGYTQVEGVDYEETFSPVAMLNSIRILLSIVAYFDYEIRQMDVKIAILNGNLEETIYMQQPEGFIISGQEQKVCKLNHSINRLKQASRSWNIEFDTAIKSYGFDQIVDEPCVYKRIINNSVAFLVHPISNEDLGEAEFVLGIQIFRDRKNKTLTLSQASYVDKIVVQYSMQNTKRGLLPFKHGVTLFKKQCPKTPQEVGEMRHIPYALAVGSLMYAMLCTRPDICYAVGIVSRYQSNPGLAHWISVKIILKYLRRTRDYMLVYGSKDLILTRYTDSDFQTGRDSRKSTSGSVFTLNEGAVVWRSNKQGCIANSTKKVEYVAACEAVKQGVWLRKFLTDLEVVPNISKPITLYYDNSGAVANSREPRSHKRGKHIEHKYHLIREIVHRGDVIVTQIASTHNVLPTQYAYHFGDSSDWGAGNTATQEGIHSFSIDRVNLNWGKHITQGDQVFNWDFETERGRDRRFENLSVGEDMDGANMLSWLDWMEIVTMYVIMVGLDGGFNHDGFVGLTCGLW
ncbi:gag/pol protein [Cucumis melo var. makuwa]|uniref:Gag/pol protein n=1 Tax=Cucumis melo var. makuwa TaxID=1194695 RepID=A0A5A7UDH2_CUCMM|nr:gag/pol protein [Cucumis melo var. makuwa]